VHRPPSFSIAHARWALAGLPLVLAACSSSPASNGASAPSADTTLQKAGSTLLTNLRTYHAQANKCKTASNPVVCLEAADRTLGGQTHDYANLLVTGHGFSAPQADLLDARNAAQTLANSMEILGDAQPTQSNYNQVLNTFNVNAAIGQLQSAAQKVNAALGG
jgi:hypothetical protein